MINETSKRLTADIYKILLQPSIPESVKERGYDFLCEIMRFVQPEGGRVCQTVRPSSVCNSVPESSAPLHHS